MKHNAICTDAVETDETQGFQPETTCALEIYAPYSVFALLRSPLFRRSPRGDLGNFDSILTTYVKHEKQHVQQFWERHFLGKPKILLDAN
jgi:hypothetical protein